MTSEHLEWRHFCVFSVPRLLLSNMVQHCVVHLYISSFFPLLKMCCTGQEVRLKIMFQKEENLPLLPLYTIGLWDKNKNKSWCFGDTCFLGQWGFYNFETDMKGRQIITRKCAKTWNKCCLFTLESDMFWTCCLQYSQHYSTSVTAAPPQWHVPCSN